MVDDAEKSDGNKVEGGMSREHLKAMVNVRKKSKKVVLDEDDNENRDAN